MRMNLGIIVGVLLLSAQSGAAPRPNSGGSESDGMRGQDRRARQAAPLQVQSSPSEISLSFDDSFDMPGSALRSLITALKANPNARTFRASWSLMVFNNQAQTTILYDRRKHSLLFYSVADGDVLGTRRDHFRFTRVPEPVFDKIAKAHRNDYSEDGWAWLGDLPKYGCRKVVLEMRRRGPV